LYDVIGKRIYRSDVGSYIYSVSDASRIVERARPGLNWHNRRSKLRLPTLRE